MAGVSRFDGWVPIRVFPGGQSLMVDWCHLGPRRFELPFFRDTIDSALKLPFNRAFRRQTPIEALVALARERPGIAPTAFVFHASRCGSTLMTQMLTSLETHVVVSEPTMLDLLLNRSPALPDFDGGVRVTWLRALVSALAQPRTGAEARFIVKFDAWNVVNLPLIRRAFPDTPWIFLYRDPVEIAASQWRRPGMHLVPGMLNPAAALVPLEAALRMPREEYVARTLGRILEAGALHCTAMAGGRPVNYDELPAIVSGTLATTFGIDTDAFSLQEMRPATRRDAKAPRFPFEPDSARKQREASTALRAAVEAHAMPHYRALEALRARLPVGRPAP